jgi:hypothetical protein
VVAHFGINYMAQLIMGFFPLVACISVVTFERRLATVRTTEKVAQSQMASPVLASGLIYHPGGAEQKARYSLS